MANSYHQILTANQEPVYAHSLPGHVRSEWELLPTHAAAVSLLASEFASAFGAKAWGEALGAWHDLGKYSKAFQAYICATEDPDAAESEQLPGRVDHSTFGARHAVESMPGLAGKLLAFCIAGHHGSLPDATATDEELAGSALERRLDKKVREIPEVTLPADLPRKDSLVFPFATPPKAEELGFAVAFFTRMIFSALIDADRTATEAFCDPPKSAERRHPKPSLADLRPAMDDFLKTLKTSKTKQAEVAPSAVNQIRAQVLAACIEKASLEPGFFSLNVPTGGGKTFASLAFALHHAKHHTTLRRVVVAIPFTSIIEQTAEEYRKALGPLAELGLIEHHSNLDPKRDTRSNQLASENWDAPLVVTTNVQLYESLFAARTTPCRKLHRLAGSVIILDEAQTMPVELLAPTLAALRELVTRYGCSVVLCTATQPALEHRPGDFEIGLSGVRPIVDDVQALHTKLKRVDTQRLGALKDEQLVDRLAEESAVLCIVNTRPHAAKLYSAMVERRGSSEGCYHLSTLMCAQHRRDILSEIRQRLIDGRSCRLISTQLIEAGVDVDFPVVYRAPAGFDSIAQAAGRCNREGRLVDPEGQQRLGQVFLFETDAPPPPGMLRQTAEKARELFDGHPDPLQPSAVEAYFRLFYWSKKREWDKYGVMGNFEHPQRSTLPRFLFRQAADAYQIIREEQTPILVPYNCQAKALLARLTHNDDADFTVLREAQRYIVGVRDSLRHTLLENSTIMEHASGLWLLMNDDGYSSETGLLDNVSGMSPDMLQP